MLVYNKHEIIDKLVICNSAEVAKLHHVEDFEVQRLLVAIKNTLSGDAPILPYWLFKNCSFALSNVVASISNMSISFVRPPNNWSNAIITSVLEVTPPKCLSDLRPISVKPILFRLCEHYVVKQYLLPAICSVNIDDQFAFKPTGSTTATIIYILHHVTLLLETNDCV